MYALCLNCENYIQIDLVEWHAQRCLYISQEILNIKDEIALKIVKLQSLFKYKNDKYSERILELINIVKDIQSEKEMRNCIDELQIIISINNNNIMLSKLLSLFIVKENQLQKQLFSNENSKTRESIQSKEELKKLIKIRQQEIQSFRLQSSIIRKKTDEALEKNSYR